MTNEINNAHDTIDSRDVIERIETLRAYLSEPGEADTDAQAELDSLFKLAKHGEAYADDWEYGATLVRGTYFEEYARELAEDCDMIDHDAAWPMRCIDWKQAADELRVDYTAIDFDGETYWIR